MESDSELSPDLRPLSAKVLKNACNFKHVNRPDKVSRNTPILKTAHVLKCCVGSEATSRMIQALHVYGRRNLESFRDDALSPENQF